MDASRFLGRCLFVLAAGLGRLPLRLQRWLGAMGGRLAYRLDSREPRVARRNFEMMMPGQSVGQREMLVREVMLNTGSNLFETLRVWTRPRASNLRLIRRVNGEELLAAALARGKGLIIAAPHYGNWELLIEYMAERGPFSLVYRVPEKKAGDVFLRLARGGDNVQLVPAETNAMRPLFKALQAGQTIGITPDQQPKFGGGEFAPFFGKPALTLSLIPKLAQRSGAPVLFAYAERVADGFELHFENASDDIANIDLIVATAAMNAQVEAIACRDLRQYQWTYKRYTLRPPDSGEGNPYWPGCY